MNNPLELTSLSAAASIDSLSDRFEAAWKAGERPRIEDYLSLAAPPLRALLLKSLLEVELELLARGGEEAQVDDYRRRFSNDLETVNAALATQDATEELEPTRPATQKADVRQSLDVALTVSVKLPNTETSRIDVAAKDALGRTSVGRFQLKALLGQGAFGSVYRARDPQLDRDVAIKMPREGVLSTSDDKQRFLREAQAAATLNHPGVCPVYEVGEEDGQPYIVMALIEGKTLDELIKSGKSISLKQAANAVRRIALALEEAHARGIVHRDLKPSNVMINRRGEPVIMDFGLARLGPQVDVQLTKSGVIMGTPAYMSPEQARGNSKDVGPPSDIYSLGVILYELAARRRPFDGSFAEVIGMILHVEPAPPSTIRNDVDRRLEAIVLRAMAKRPEDRYPTIASFAEALGEYISGTPIEPNVSNGDVSTQIRTSSASVSSIRNDVEEGHDDVRRADAESTTVAVCPVPTEQRQSPRRRWLVGSGLLGGLLILGIIFFARTRTTTVLVDVDVDLQDPTLRFFLDEQPISAEALSRPIELTVNDHELRVLRHDAEYRRYRFVVLGGRSPGIQVTEMHSGPADKPDPVAETDDSTLPAGKWLPLIRTAADLVPDKTSFLGDEGSADFHDGALILKARAMYKSPRFARDYILRAKVKKLGGSHVQLGIRYNPARNLNGFTLGFSGSSYRRGKFSIGKYEPSGRWLGLQHQEMQIVVDNECEVALAAKGDTISGYVNGHLVLELKDTTHLEGYPVLTVRNDNQSHGEFRNAEMFILDGTDLSPDQVMRESSPPVPIDTPELPLALELLDKGSKITIQYGDREVEVSNPNNLPSSYFRIVQVEFGNAGKVRDLTYRLLVAHAMKSLDCSDTDLNDESAAVLVHLKRLRRLDVRRTEITAAGVTKLRAALPDCTILSDDGNP